MLHAMGFGGDNEQQLLDMLTRANGSVSDVVANLPG